MKNAQLWKRILNEGIIPAGDVEEAALADAIIRSPIIIDQRPVPDRIQWTSDHSVSVPFESFWIEGAFWQQTGDLVGSVATFFRSDDPRIGSQKIRCPSGGFLAIITTVMEMRDFKPYQSGSVAVAIEANGIVVVEREVRASDISLKCFPDKASALSASDGVAWLVFSTLEMLSCKNVSLKPNENDPTQVRRAIKRHGGTPDSYRYHTLVVRPPGAKSDTPGQDIGIMPRHVCRGHFSEYGPEFGKGLLFGKYAGRFYIPPHLKGDKKNGVVEKDYAIPACATPLPFNNCLESSPPQR